MDPVISMQRGQLIALALQRHKLDVVSRRKQKNGIANMYAKKKIIINVK
jgi:hypothetical protein